MYGKFAATLLAFVIAQAAPQGNAEKGRESFKAHGCISCHGFSGWGGAGARLAQNPIHFIDHWEEFVLECMSLGVDSWRDVIC